MSEVYTFNEKFREELRSRLYNVSDKVKGFKQHIGTPGAESMYNQLNNAVEDLVDYIMGADIPRSVALQYRDYTMKEISKQMFNISY
jgi:hypothetical protein